MTGTVALPDAGPVLSADGRRLFFHRTISAQSSVSASLSDKDVYMAERQADGRWGPARALGSPVNNGGSNSPMWASPDGRELLLLSRYNADGSFLNKAGMSRTRQQADGSWEVPTLAIERRSDFAQIAASNVDSWFGRHHPAWELRTGDFAEVTANHVEDASVDRIVLDMLAPWENIEEGARVLVPGGLFLAYVATTTQLSRTVEALRHSGLYTEPESWESMVRTWNVDGLSMRPDHTMVAHTGFLLTARRLAAGSSPLTRKRPPARGAYDDGGYWIPEDVKERTSTDRKIRRVLRDCLAKQPEDHTPVLPGTPQKEADQDA